MDLVDAARVLAMGNLVDSDAGIACWDSKYHYLFWRPIMAIRNAQIDGNPATTPDPNWTPLLTTPNHPEYPAAHTCLSGAESEMYAHVLGTHNIDVTIHGSADGTPNNWAAIHTFKTVKDLQREGRQRTRLGGTALPRIGPRGPQTRPRRRTLDAPALLPTHLPDSHDPRPARLAARRVGSPPEPNPVHRVTPAVVADRLRGNGRSIAAERRQSKSHRVAARQWSLAQLSHVAPLIVTPRG